MERFCYSVNAQNIELSEFQLEMVAEFSAQLPPLHTRQKATYAAIIVSIIFHLLLISFIIDYLEQPEQKPSPTKKHSRSFKVKIITNTNSKNNSVEKMVDTKKIQPVREDIVENAIEKTEYRAVKAVEINQPTVKQKNDNGPKIDTKTSKKTDNIASELDPLVYDENVEIYEPTPEAFNSGTLVFNPLLLRQIEEIQKKKFEREKNVGYRQLQKDNEYYEFKPVGGATTVRINGNCFIVPEDKPFASTQELWSLLGNCEKEGPKLNFDEPELKYRYNRKND